MAELTSSDAVREALAEFDALGREPFLAKYGFGPAKRYFVEQDGKLYDSKAIYGVAIGFQYPDRGHMRNNEFSGGEGVVIPQLSRLGFQIRDTGGNNGDLTSLVLPQEEVDRFAAALSTPEYLQEERKYKVAVHEVISRLLAVETISRPDFPTLLTSFFERKLDLAELGIEGDLAIQIRAELEGPPFYGPTNAFVQLAGGGFAVNNFIWIPEAVRVGLGEPVREAFASLVDDQVPLTDRVEGFRSRLYAAEEASMERGGFKPEWKLIKISLAFTAALLGTFDPSRYTPYHHGKLKKSYEDFVGPWPKQQGGELYATVCGFVQAVADALRRQGAPIEDLIDAQSFLWLRADQTGVSKNLDRVGALHLIAKWSAQHGADTVKLHQDVATEHGEVWWGVIGSPDKKKLSDDNFARLRGQLDSTVQTYVFLAGSPAAPAFRTRLVDIETDRPSNDQLIPSYYPSALHHSLWLKLAEFEQIDHAELQRQLEPSAQPGRLVTLANQTNPLLVRIRSMPRVWWVNQGSSYQRAREGGYLWAPTQTRSGGTPFDYWRNMNYLRDGDYVLNYANTQIRAVSRVTKEATPSVQPVPVADEAWNNDGLRADVDYRDLGEPVRLGDIPNEWRTREGGPFAQDGNVKQGYLFPVSDAFAKKLNDRFPQLGLPMTKAADDEGQEIEDDSETGYVEPSFETIVELIHQEGMTISTDAIRRYHLSLKTRGFVVLSGISGTGKTWLGEAHARAVTAKCLLVPVAPNWTTNEDLLGYLNPVDNHYHDTEFSVFLRDAAAEHARATAAAQAPRPYHLILDEMNLARVEQYFAKFLSAMELRTRSDNATIELAPEDAVALTPNLKFVGTVNVDETTHGFADKVFDRSQLIELTISRDDVIAHLGERPYARVLTQVWEIFQRVAPFAFRVLDEINAYVDEAVSMGIAWQTAIDEQLLQKVLTKVKGTDLALGSALQSFVELAAEQFPLSYAKAETMRAAFTEHGFTSYF